MNYQTVWEQIKVYEPHSQDFHFLDLQKVNAKLAITNHYIYYGQFENNQRHGKGILLQQNGRKYEGQWQNDLKQGYGWEFLANGSQYEGNYVTGKPHGQGKFIWANGDVYEGQWNQGVKEGQGTWHGLKGEQYQGEWSNNVAFGYGEYIQSNGDRYVGHFKSWLKNGEGQEYFSNGDLYSGNYLNGKPHGYGEYYWSNGAVFQGYFKDGLRYGKGIWKRRVDSPTDQYQGEYDEDKKNGYGIYKWSNGNEYRGAFINDYKHGYGEMHYVDGMVLKGNWEQGKLVSEIKSNSPKKTQSSFNNHMKIIDNTHCFNKSCRNNNKYIEIQFDNSNQVQNNGYNDFENERLSNSYIEEENSNKNAYKHNNPFTSQTNRTIKTIRIRQYQKDKSLSMSQQNQYYGSSTPKRDFSEKNEKQKTQTKFCIKTSDNYYLQIRRPKIHSQYLQNNKQKYLDMQLLRVYLIRHGQSMYQSLKIVSGKNEFGLSGLGVVQSKRVGNLLHSVKFDQVYTSDYKRCIESYSHIESQLKLKPRVITYTTLLREVDQGNEMLKSYQEVYALAKPKQSSSLNGEIQERVETFLDQLIRDQIYKKSYKFFSYRDSLASQFDTSNLYNPSIQQFSSYSKGSGMINILVLSHAGFIAETLKYLYQRNNSHQTNAEYPFIYARNGAIFQLDFQINDLKNWNCNVSLMNSKRKINTPFDSII
ncbi:unnamed protein product [Paramecium octaurelia]|uniref:Phosphoglycerate mutase n=1 Tax=Paramecium octaurelia TaxID=43137 RepID=A0A8S1T1H7_PAROT|nr:unnamed protein product [Paramecium octaurelia]